MQISGEILTAAGLVAAGAVGGQLLKIVATKGWGYVLARAHALKDKEVARLKALGLDGSLVDRVAAIETKLGLTPPAPKA